MQNYVLFSDSTGDLTPELVQEADLRILPMSFVLDGVPHKNYPDNREMDPHLFYDKLREGGNCTTSQVSLAEFCDAFAPVLEAGQDILYLSFSSGLSGTYQTSRIALDDMQERYPGRKIICVDTLQASMGEGLLVFTAGKMRQNGATMEEIATFVEHKRQEFCAWFTVDDLMFLKRGGRLSGAAAVAGTLLGIKPVLHVDPAGHLIAMEKVRGRRASLDALVKHFTETAIDPAEQTVFISHGDCLQDCEYVAEAIRRIGVKRICIGTIGPVIGAHSGPGTVALFFRGTHR